MKLKYILMCAMAMIGIATQAQDDVNYDISDTPATEVVEGHMYVLQNRKYTEIGLAYDGFGATTFDPVSDQLGQFVTSVQNFFFTAGEDGFTLPVTLDNINDANIDWGYGETGGGTVLSPKRKAADNTVYFTVKDAAGQYVMLYNSTLYGVNATTPAECAQWIAYEVKEHEHKWETNGDRTHYCTVCSVEEEEHSYIDGVCEICQHVCRHSSYIDGACEYCGKPCEHKNGWEFNEEDDYYHYCIDCYHQERHHIAEDGGACVCGFECPGHEFFFDSEVSISASNETTGEYVMHFECVFCQYQKTETVDPDAECPNGDQHSWDVWVEKPTCTMRGYTLHRCCYCELEYISDFTDIDPDNHNWCLGYVEDEEGNITYTHYCGDGCEAYCSEQEHEMDDNGSCTVCGYWPGHTEHKWQTDDMYHHCSILGCQEYGEDWSDHEFDEHCTCTICGFTRHVWGENGICENCGTGCQHEWNHGYCYICNTECNHDDHNSIVPAAAIPATCTKEGWKKHYECSICQMMFANAEGEDIWDYSDDFVIEKLGHDIGDDLCCHREGCGAKVTISSTEITLGEAANVDFMNYTINYNDDDPTAEPLYKIVVAEPALYSFSIPESIARQLDSPGVDVFDKNFKWVVDTSLDPDYLSSIFFEEAGTYYLQPNAYSERDVEFVRKAVPLTIDIVESITLNPEEITDVNGDPVVITRTEDGSYATKQTIDLDDAVNIPYIDVEFSVPAVSYTRDISAYTGSNWGTLCLPFDYTVADAASAGLSIYEFTAASAEAVTVTHKTEGTVKYGTPVLFKKTGEGEGASLTLSATSTKMGFDQVVIDDINGLQLWGTFEPMDVTSGYYLDAQDGMLYSIEEYCISYGCDLTIPAYRAWFEGSVSNDNEAKAFNIIIDDEEMTAIDALNAFIQGKADIYGLDGQKRSDLQRGINIVNGKKILVK